MTTLKLTTSVMHGQEEIKELNFRKPVAKDLRKFELTDLNKFVKIQELTAFLCALPTSVLDNIDAIDLVRCAKIVSDFFQSSLETPENAS